MDALDKLWRWRENFSATLSRNVLQTSEEINVEGEKSSVVEDVYQDFLVKPHLVKIFTFWNILNTLYDRPFRIENLFEVYKVSYNLKTVPRAE